MKNNVEEIMKEYREGIKKIEDAYTVKKVAKINISEINKKIDYEKSFIERLENESKETNKELIERAKERLEEALKEKEDKEKQKRDKAELKNEKVILPSGREVTRAEKDEIDKNHLKDTAIRKLTQESKEISETLMKKDKELKENVDKKMNFRYEFEKDADGKSTGKVLNEGELDKIIDKIARIQKDMVELNKMQLDCQKYLDEFKQKDQEKMDKFAKTWNDVKKDEKETEKNSEEKPEANQGPQQKPEADQGPQQKPEADQGPQQKPEADQGPQQKPETDQKPQENPTILAPNKILGGKNNDINKPKIVISRNVSIGTEKNSRGIGKIRSILKLDKNEKYESLKKILVNENEETLNAVIEKVDPLILQGIVELQENNMISNYEAQKSIKRLAGSIATKEKLPFELEYNMKDLSKGAFWPWNRSLRNQVAKTAEENREKGIAEFTNGIGYEPNPIKRMLAKVKQKKLGDGEEKNIEENKEPILSNAFKKKIIEEAQKSEYDIMREEISNAENKGILKNLYEHTKELTNMGKLTATEIQDLINNIKEGIQKNEQKEKQVKNIENVSRNLRKQSQQYNKTYEWKNGNIVVKEDSENVEEKQNMKDEGRDIDD